MQADSAVPTNLLRSENSALASEGTWWTDPMPGLWVLLPLILGVGLLVFFHLRTRRNKSDFATLLATYPGVAENYLPILMAFASGICGWALESADKDKIRDGFTDPWSMLWLFCLAVFGPSVYLLGRLWKVSEQYNRNANERADCAERRMRFLEKANQLFLEVVDEKLSRVSRCGQAIMACTTSKDFVHNLHKAQDPSAQIKKLLVATHAVIERHLSEKRIDGLNYRVALFCKQGNVLRVSFAIDGGVKSKKAVAGPDRKGCGQFYELKEPVSERTFAVYTAYRSEPQVIPDTTDLTAAAVKGFRYLGDYQRSKIKSILAIPFGSNRASGGASDYVLCIDANQPGAFLDLPEEIERFSMICANLERRMLLESAVSRYFKRGMRLP